MKQVFIQVVILVTIGFALLGFAKVTANWQRNRIAMAPEVHQASPFAWQIGYKKGYCRGRHNAMDGLERPHCWILRAAGKVKARDTGWTELDQGPYAMGYAAGFREAYKEFTNAAL